MYGALCRDGLDVRHRRGVNHVYSTRRLGDSDIHAPPVTSDSHVVRVAAQRDFLDDLQGLRVDDVERTLRFVTDVDAAAVRGGPSSMVDLDPRDHPNHLVRSGIDDVDVVPCAVGLNDPDLVLRGQGDRAENDRGQHRERRRSACVIVIAFNSLPLLFRCSGLSKHPGLQCLPFGVVLRAEVLAAIVIEVAASLLLERMKKEPALQVAGHDYPPYRQEVLARILVVPGRASRGQRL